MTRILTTAVVTGLATLGQTAEAMPVTPLATADLDALRWQARPVVVLSAPDDPRLARQLALFDAAAAAMAEREMPVFVGSVAEGVALLPRGTAAGEGFAVVLIGKDGGVKARHQGVVDPAALTGLVDTMPMRRSEARLDD